MDAENIDVDNELGFLKEILKDAKKAKSDNSRVYIVSGLGHNYGGSYKKCIRNIVAGLLFFVYRLFGVKTARIGLSFGPITKTLALTERFRSKFIDYYYVRDTKSLELCQSIGIKNAKVCPDMSWLYDMDGERFLNKSNNICVNLKMREGNLDNEIKYQDEMVHKCEDIINRIYTEDSTIYFCCQVLEDEECCKQLFSRFANKYKCALIDKQLHLDDVREVYGNCEYNISNRMHSLLLGYKYGALPIALIDQDKQTKIQQTMVDSGLEELSIDVCNSSSEKIDNIVDNRERLASMVFKAEEKRVKEIKAVLESIFC